MITSFTIKKVATFNDEGVTINDLKKVNIIYGSNGSGKSTIGKVIADIDSFDQSTILWENDRPIEILAYNKEFCKKNFSEGMPGVFTLGEAGTSVVAELEKKNSELNEIIIVGKKYKNEIDKQTKSRDNEIQTFRESSWGDVLKKHEQWFSKSAIGAGTKDKFVDKLLQTFKQERSKSLPFDELKRRAEILFAAKPLKMNLFTLIDNSKLSSIESDHIWKKIIVGKQDVDIAALILRLSNSDWVSKGIEYIENGSDVCPFCQQHTISTDFRSKINSFFDETFKQNVDKVNDKCEEYKNEVQILIHSLDILSDSIRMHDNKFVDNNILCSILDTLKATFDKNLELISLKQKEPSRIISLTDTSDIINSFNSQLIKGNTSIKSHNDLVDNFTKEKSTLINEIWKFFAAEYDTTISAHIRKINGIDKAVETLKQKHKTAQDSYKAVRNEIIRLENSVTSITPTVNEINRLLKGYGFTNFQIQEDKDRKNFYQIVRENGIPAQSSLSEGETTFITFLYYMQLVKGSFNPDGITTDRVLVIDDPVSSLDSNVLFVVSTLLRDVFTDIHESKNAVKQVILLTHNVYFHKEISFLDKHCKWRDNVRHCVLRKRNNISSIQDYGKDNPIKSSYELMWTELKSVSQHSSIVVQNIMRRIIENYFFVLGGISPDVILEKFECPEERTVCRSLLSWVNDGSHSLPDDLFVEIPDEQLDRYQKVFKDIFYRMGQDAHYDMMMQVKDKEDENSIM